ncbi:MAG: hypothetical protein MJ072_03375, partial [Clostridia bacterium]|nr:hypothetical protein [Clostridia bacterium]
MDSTYEESYCVDKNGALLDDLQVISDMVVKGEDVYLVGKDPKRAMLIKTDKWGLPNDSEFVASPALTDSQKIVDLIVGFDKLLPSEFKLTLKDEALGYKEEVKKEPFGIKEEDEENEEDDLILKDEKVYSGNFDENEENRKIQYDENGQFLEDDQSISENDDENEIIEDIDKPLEIEITPKPVEDKIVKKVETREDKLRAKLWENIEKSYADPKKVRTHVKAKQLTYLQSPRVGDRINPFYAEFGRLEEKYGGVPDNKNVMPRTIQFLFKIDGSDASRSYNEKLYKSYLAGTDEAKIALKNAFNGLLNLDTNELAFASRSIEDAVDYCGKHFLEMQVAFTIATLNGNPSPFTNEFGKFVKNNVHLFEDISKVYLMAETAGSELYMADVYNEPAFKNIDMAGLSVAVPGMGNESRGFTDTTFTQGTIDAMQQLRKDAERFRRDHGVDNYFKGVKQVANDEETQREIGGTGLEVRSEEELRMFDSMVALKGERDSMKNEFQILLNA